MRTFISVDLSEGTKQKLCGLIESLKGFNLPVKWTGSGGLHLTLKFLGEVDEKRLGELESLVGEAVKGTVPFSLKLKGLGIFPGTKNPRVIWVGASEGSLETARMAVKIDELLSSGGFAEKEARAFSTHITIGRVKDEIKGVDLTKIIETFDMPDLGVTEVDRVNIMKSSLTPKGAIYNIERSVRLA